MWNPFSKPAMPTAESALPGRSTPVPVPERHEVLGTPMTGPWPGQTSRASRASARACNRWSESR